MKVIFLDIDGVLNCESTENPRSLPYHVDPKLIPRLHRLIELTGAQVVLSSTWRYDPAGIFSAKNQGIPFIGSTPDLQGQPRYREILNWVGGRKDVDRYVVIDDEDDDLDSLPLFQPSPKIGLTDEIVDAAAAYLNGETDKDMRRPKIVRLVQNLAAVFKGHKG